jgi:leucyl aminopeptidase
VGIGKLSKFICMNISIVSKDSGKANVSVIFYVKKAILFSPVLSEAAQEQVDTILDGMEDGPFQDLELLELDEHPILFVNAAKERGLDSLDQLRMAGFRLSKHAQKRKLAIVNLMLADAAPEQVAALVSGFHHADYRFDKYKSKPTKTHSVHFEINAGSQTKAFQAAVAETAVLMESATLCRNLVNEPGGSLIPSDFVKVAQQVAKKSKLAITVRNKAQLEKEGFQGLLTVGRGGENPPSMVTLSYKPTKATKGVHLGIVGKGVTFDTGGISIKPAQGMWEMREDMAGAATTLTAIQAIAALQLPIQVTAVLCLTENRPGANAVLPGDIFTAKNGKTIMVENTDAEGRLILTDGLWEAGSHGVTHLIDIATLTGAIVRALGNVMAGVFCNDIDFTQTIVESSRTCGEKFWPMPLEEEYAESIQDKVADFKNVTGEVGAITAALFLREFIPENVKWAHWDIAGTAYATKEWKYTSFGSTAFGIQSLVAIAKKLSAS